MNVLVSLLIFAGLTVLHESGHMLAGYVLGIPKSKMSMQFMNREKKKNFISTLIFSIAPHIALLDDKNQKISPGPDQMDKYVEILEYYIPSEKRMFWFVAGGHAFEFIMISIIAVISLVSTVGIFKQVAFNIVQMALVLTAVYLLMELFSALRSRELSGGDFSGQWAISPVKTILFYVTYFTGLIGVWILLK